VSRRSTWVCCKLHALCFHGIAGGTDAHTVAGSYSVVLSRSTQFSAFGGISRYENVFVQIVPIDPAIAAVIGISSAQRVSYQGSLTPNVGARLSKVVPRARSSCRFRICLTRKRTLPDFDVNQTPAAGIATRGLRRWSITAGANYNESNFRGNIIGQYGSYMASLSASRQVDAHELTESSLSTPASTTAGDFKNYNKWTYAVNLGLSFAPGDIPIRFW